MRYSEFLILIAALVQLANIMFNSYDTSDFLGLTGAATFILLMGMAIMLHDYVYERQ